ncbi:MAG: VPLPA-CTERM sorting domain-containing protein [Pseudomonadota bacterium]
MTADDADFSGDVAGFAIDDDDAFLTTPRDYVSEAFLSNMVFFKGESFASFGATPGVFVKEYGDDDSIVVTVVDPNAAVPLPAGLGLLASGLVAFGLMRRFKHSDQLS